MSVISNIFDRLFSAETNGDYFNGPDAVLSDMYERADDYTEDSVQAALDADGVGREVRDGIFQNHVEVELVFDLGAHGPQTFTFAMPDSPTDMDAELNQFVTDLGFEDSEAFMLEAMDGIEVEFVRVSGEWRPAARAQYRAE